MLDWIHFAPYSFSSSIISSVRLGAALNKTCDNLFAITGLPLLMDNSEMQVLFLSYG